MLLASSLQQAAAQSKATGARGYIPWFKVQNQAMVLQTGNQSKPLSQDITLPNGVRVEYRTQSVVLTSGKRVVLQEGDMLAKAGLNIYETVAAATGCQQFVFGYDTNFTIGYLLSL